MRSLAGVILLLLALVACGSAPTQVAATDKDAAKAHAQKQVAEAEAFALDAQRQIDAAAAAVAEAERVVAEQAAKARASRSKPRARSAPTARPRVAPTGDVWGALARCESGGRNDHGAPYYGYFQFSAQTWHGIGMSGLPDEYDYGTQLAAAQRLQARSGWGQWPVCSRKIGVR